MSQHTILNRQYLKWSSIPREIFHFRLQRMRAQLNFISKKHFKSLSIYCRNPKEKMKEDKTNIEFSNVQMSLTLPATVKCSKAAVRGLWVNYDHLSDYCKSTIFMYDDGDRKKLTLRKTTKREWKKRKELLQKALHQIFNEKPDENADDQPRQIDIDKMYTEYEDELNGIEREKMGPEGMALGEFEVNLRRNKIVGGVYQIEYLEQPLQDVKADEGALLRTCRKLSAT